MNRPELPTWCLDGCPPHRRLLACWRGLDTDWKSVCVAATLVTVVVGLGVPVPA